MCPQFQESTQCTTADLAAPDGTSAKLATACGAWPVGLARKIRNRSHRSSVPLISAAISSTPLGLMATATANSFSEKFFAPTKTMPPSADPTKNFTLPQKFRRKIAAGPADANFLSTIVIRLNTSSSTSKKSREHCYRDARPHPISHLGRQVARRRALAARDRRPA